MVRGKGNASPEARHPPPCPREKAMLGMLCSMELHHVPNSTFWAPHPLKPSGAIFPCPPSPCMGWGKPQEPKQGEIRRDIHTCQCCWWDAVSQHASSWHNIHPYPSAHQGTVSTALMALQRYEHPKVPTPERHSWDQSHAHNSVLSSRS